MTRSWLLPILSLAVLAGIFLLAQQDNWGASEAELLIDFGNGERRSFRGEVTRDMNVRLTLAAIAQAGLAFEYDLASGQVRSVNGVSGRWEFTKNGRAALTSPAAIRVFAGDRLILRRISP